MSTRIGQGFDVHQLETGIPLFIGGVTIPFDKGSKGHSDGDVLYHALTDAILGALAMGDIGEHFPSNDVRWQNADSSQFLTHAFTLIQDKGFELANIDSTIILQSPQIGSYIKAMRENIAGILRVNINLVSVKATTTDKLGFTGIGDGIAASAVVLLKRADGS